MKADRLRLSIRRLDNSLSIYSVGISSMFMFHVAEFNENIVFVGLDSSMAFIPLAPPKLAAVEALTVKSVQVAIVCKRWVLSPLDNRMHLAFTHTTLAILA